MAAGWQETKNTLFYFASIMFYTFINNFAYRGEIKSPIMWLFSYFILQVNHVLSYELEVFCSASNSKRAFYHDRGLEMFLLHVCEEEVCFSLNTPFVWELMGGVLPTHTRSKSHTHSPHLGSAATSNKQPLEGRLHHPVSVQTNRWAQRHES